MPPQITNMENPNQAQESLEQQQQQQVKVPENDKLTSSERWKTLQAEAIRLPDMNIAVSGLAGRFPKCNSIGEFEESLYHGIDMVNDNDESRFSCGLWGLPPRAGRLKELNRFDCEFFGFNYDEANYIDYQLRILYEVVYESILDAGLNPANLRGSKTGVFFGLHCNEFENAMADDPQFKTNGYYAQFASKIADYFDFKGLTLTFDAACASGFVGLHNAIQALNDGLIDQAIVCSSNIPIHPTGSFIFLQMQMLSPTGYSRFLDSRADGYVKSEAVVSVVIQKKHLAFRNYASVMASKTSVDGYKPEGITFPSDKSQERLIRSTKELAGISTDHVEYLEAHGTGTPAGDPQEAAAIANVYYPSSTSNNDTTSTTTGGEQHDSPTRSIGPLLVGSVKTNMGHSEAASGLCALAKVALMLENEIIYKGLHYAEPNTNIESMMTGKLKFVDETMKLNSKIVPLSCYGFGGSNVHAIVRANEKPSIDEDKSSLSLCNNIGDCENEESADKYRLIVMFGRSEQLLGEFFDKLKNKDNRQTRNCLSEDFFLLLDQLSSQRIDRLMNYRGFMVIKRGGLNKGDHEEASRMIADCLLDEAPKEAFPHLAKPHHQECQPRQCNLILPGLGSEWPAMASGLKSLEQFWSTIERLATLWEPAELDLVDLLTREPPAESTINGQQLSMCEKFVSIVAYQIALINIIKEQLKVNNIGYIVGHSLGEISAAYAAGLFDERETIRVAYQIGKTLDLNKHLLVEGRMFAVMNMNELEAEELISKFNFKTIKVCCINGDESITLSGSKKEMDEFHKSCIDLNKVFVKEIESNSIPIHNPLLMNENNFKQILKDNLLKVLFPLADYNRLTANGNGASEGMNGWFSSVETDNKDILRQANADYFAECICNKVNFSKQLKKFQHKSIVLEVSPNGIFEAQFRLQQQQQQQQENNNSSKQKATTGSELNSSYQYYVKMMKSSVKPQEQALFLLKSIGQLYLNGATFNLTNFYHPHKRSIEQQQQGENNIFPVRRQTPSLSSVFNWSHNHDLFVPRYPLHFGKSSAKCEIPIDVLHDRDKYITDHCVEGRCLFPATGYLFLIWRVFSFTKRKIYDACFHDVEKELIPIEFRNVRLMRAVICGNKTTQLYIHYEEGSGRFEIKEGGSVVVEGYVQSPTENPEGLLYDSIRESIKNENLELTMTEDDVYKQFRVSGYDYGENFRNIKKSSSDGRYSSIKFNGHFVALTDSILQTIFLAVSQYAPSGGLFLPTRFDYIRLQPKLLLDKLRKVGAVFDLTENSLNTKEKREIMTKIMQREKAAASEHKNMEENVQEQSFFYGNKMQTPQSSSTPPTNEPKPPADQATTTTTTKEGQDVQEEGSKKKEEEEKEEKPKVPDCFFDTYCDPITGIIITDGIEMRGIKATPAPRRQENNSGVHLESYQFIKDNEEPIEDERLTKYKEVNVPYVKICNSLSMKLLVQLCGQESLKGFKNKEDLLDFIDNHEFIEEYKSKHLKSVYKVKEVVRGGLEEPEGEEEEVEVEVEVEEAEVEKETQKEEDDDKKKEEEKEKDDKKKEEDYDIRKNGAFMLLSVLDQLIKEEVSSQRVVKNIIQTNRTHLMKDLIQNSFHNERFMRPLLEIIIENICFKKMKLKILEINVDDGLVKDSLYNLIQNIEPTMSLDYSIAHPNIERLQEQKLLVTTTTNTNLSAKTFTLKENLETLFSEQQFGDLDLIVYKDISCYSLPKQVIEQNGLSPVLSSLNDAIRRNGFVLIIMRKELTLAERILLALSEPELVGVTKKDFDEFGSLNKKAFEKIEHINTILQSRYELMLSEARKNKMLFISQKSDKSGCSILLFRSITNNKQEEQAKKSLENNNNLLDQEGKSIITRNNVGENQSGKEEEEEERVILHVKHDNCENISAWLEELKKQFSKPKEENTKENNDDSKEETTTTAAAAATTTTATTTTTDSASTNDNNNLETIKEEEKQDLNNNSNSVSNKTVWLCGLATKDTPISGIVGMMRALIKELGSVRLRCYLDNYTFRNRASCSIDLVDIEKSKFFQLSLKRNLLWNCVDSMGNFGSYRHLTINSYVGYENYLCENVAPTSHKNTKLDHDDDAGDGNYKLVKGAYINNATKGDLSSFSWFEAPLKYLTPKEEQEDLIQVAYSALNFRDIMLSTGRLPLDAIPIRLAASDCLLGLEFSGINRQNKRLMGMVFARGLGTHVLCPKKSSVKLEIPDDMSLKEAATIPVVYSTAIMALIYRGKMKPGESILIHAGSGGVGQAAIRLASHYKLEIYTTVGSEEKKKFLLEEFPGSLKEENIFSSRDCEFENKIMHATHGRGVDLVLNSLADDKLHASVRCLADGGRFLEIGKYDLSLDTRFELTRLDTNKTFHGILIDKIFDIEEIGRAFGVQLRNVLDTLKQGLKEGFVKPIKHTVFKRDKVEEAFRFMATGKHIGKILIEIDEGLEKRKAAIHNNNMIKNTSTTTPNSKLDHLIKFKCMPRFQLSPTKSYIVTGGLGGFGMELTKWLVGQGARHLLITSRNGLKTGYQKTTLSRLAQNSGVKYKIITYDTTSEEGVELLLNEALELSPGEEIGGIFHLAMVLKDTLIENMSAEDFELVCRPKVNTCIHLDSLMKKKEIKLDYFVAFSSVTSGKGNAGQANYAYANSCLERICELRRARGEHGMAIQWGAIGDVGVAYENLGGNDIVIGGTVPQRIPSCLQTLARLLDLPFSTCMSVVPINRGQDGVGDKTDLVGAIMHVLGIKDPSKVSEHATLGELGLDSLMAVEIRQYIEREYDMTLNIQEIRSLTISKIKEISDNAATIKATPTSTISSKSEPETKTAEKTN